MSARTAVIAALAVVFIAGIAVAGWVALRGQDTAQVPAAVYKGFVIDTNADVADTMPFATTGWELSAAVCDPSLDTVVADYRTITHDTRTDAWWARTVDTSTAHCG